MSTETSHLDGLKPNPIGLMMVIPVPTSEEQMSDSILGSRRGTEFIKGRGRAKSAKTRLKSNLNL